MFTYHNTKYDTITKNNNNNYNYILIVLVLMMMMMMLIVISRSSDCAELEMILIQYQKTCGLV